MRGDRKPGRNRADGERQMHNRHGPWGGHCDRFLIYRRYPAAEAGFAELDEFLLGSPSLAAEARMRERMRPRPDPAADLVRVLCEARQRRSAAFKNLSLLAAPLSLRIWASVLGVAVMLVRLGRPLAGPGAANQRRWQ
jgi:hypothetical protein